ncbi:adenosylcobinamide-phosphate guanylyltransferase [Haloarcula vallismortis]|uniref:4-diphosphocytidyl-2C-methyl-D-erythritol synthase n=3 Tax=Haloarcula vallismortis TaxID=28442 RepID=M0JV40_HALVA|nr:4-diphosphocytidyl-2C-methyl-D-erythritol synthase [Haloarcula vallismortis ATCC 29715]SDW43076.1 adenosylcobinamide-phosphate guanylyltransferase [Haloarcula vallismortis]
MDALVMCGGRGTRLDTDAEKPLFRVGGVPMVDRVVGALQDSAVERVIAVTSPNAPETRSHLNVPCIETPGEGYVADLDTALADDRLSRPALTVAADLPLLEGEVVDRVLDTHEGGSLTVLVPASLKRALGVSDDTTFEDGGREVAPTGVNVVGDGPDDARLMRDRRVAVNVNTLADARVAEQWL